MLIQYDSASWSQMNKQRISMENEMFIHVICMKMKLDKYLLRILSSTYSFFVVSA